MRSVLVWDFSVQALSSLCLCGGFVFPVRSPQRTQSLHREESKTLIRRRTFSITTNLFSPNEISEILKARSVLSKAVSSTCGGLCEVAIWSFQLSSHRCRRSPCDYTL